MRLLGISGDRLRTYRLPVRRLNEHRQDILEEMVAFDRAVRPDLVLTMNSCDTHQDHEVVHAESVRAFRKTTLLGYETPWNQATGHFDLFVELDEDDVALKKKMLMAYQSQVALGRPYVSEDFVETTTRFRGYHGKLSRAEVYEVLSMRWELP